MKFGPAYTIVHKAMRRDDMKAAHSAIVDLQKQIVVLDQSRVMGKPEEIDDTSILGRSLRELEHDLSHEQH